MISLPGVPALTNDGVCTTITPTDCKNVEALAAEERLALIALSAFAALLAF